MAKVKRTDIPRHRLSIIRLHECGWGQFKMAMLHYSPRGIVYAIRVGIPESGKSKNAV